MWRGLTVYSGICPDPECHTKLYFPSYASSSVECTGCGQHHAKESLLGVEDVEDPDLALRSLLRSVLLGQTSSKTTPDLVKVKGYSNYHCKLLSPLLTFYGMDRRTGEAKLLREMSNVEVFDCALLGDRAFQIELEHMETAGYGRDKTGSLVYLKETLEAIKLVNGNEERLVPVHVDGDGHCLVHAISRALVGREIFWHALRANLKNHLETEILKYKGLFRDFIDDDEWRDIISEADPYFQPPDGEGLGLRNIHLFGLANVLHRPIILLDSVSGIQSSGDYSGIFLPALIPVDKCKSKEQILNKPLAVAWSSSGRNHFIPLVGVKDRPVPKLPQWLIPKAWGIPNEVVKQYVEFDNNGHCFIGGQRCLQDKYMQRLVKAMDDLFIQENSISAQLVTEVHQYIYKPSGMVGMKPETVTKVAHVAITEGRLHRCLSCNALRESHLDVPSHLLRPGGELYNIALQNHGDLQEGLSYSFPSHQGLVCMFDAEADVLVPIKQKNEPLLECHLCHGPLRRVKSDGSVVYTNGDRTSTPVRGKSRCGCGYKHYWNGKEYENMPEFFPISLEWGGKSVSETVYWFQYEEDPSFNSNVYDVAAKLVQKHFPGEFGSERLVQKVVDTILRQTAKKEGENKGAKPSVTSHDDARRTNADQDGAAAGPFMPSKIILTGEKKKTMHREELTMSETERVLKTRTEHHAAIMQKRRSGEPAKKAPEKGAKIAKQQSAAKTQGGPPTNPEGCADVPIPSPPPQLARTDKKVRLSTSDGQQRMLTLPMDTTFKQLQEKIESELGISSGQQRIRYGFPPRELHPPEEGHEEDPVPLQHGDRVMVEHVKPVVPEERPPDVVMSEVEGQGGKDGVQQSAPTETGGPVAEIERSEQMQADDTVAMTSALISALGALTGVDMWEGAQNCAEMFDKGGFYYNKVSSDLGPLYPNQHCSLPVFPNKVFAYNAEKDRLDLCLGQRHIQVQPLDSETLMLAHTRPTQAAPTAERSSGLSSEASFSGAIGQRDTSLTRVAFSGAGRTLSGAQSPKKIATASLLPGPLLATQAMDLTPLSPRVSQTTAVDPQSDLHEVELQTHAMQESGLKEQNQETRPAADSMASEQLLECREVVDNEDEANIHEVFAGSSKTEPMETEQSQREARNRASPTVSESGPAGSESGPTGGESVEENQETTDHQRDVAVEPSIAVSGSSSPGAQGDMVMDRSGDGKEPINRKEHASEVMDTDQSCTPAQDVTPVSTDDVDVTEDEKVTDDGEVDINVQQRDVTTDCVNTGPSDTVTQVPAAMDTVTQVPVATDAMTQVPVAMNTVTQVPVAMEIDTQRENDMIGSPDKLELSSNENESYPTQDAELLKNEKSSQPVTNERVEDEEAPATAQDDADDAKLDIESHDSTRTDEGLKKPVDMATVSVSLTGEKITDREEKAE